MRSAFLLVLALCWPAHAATLATVRARNTLSCGVVHAAQDWSKDDVHGDLSPLGREFCRAAAVAVLGRAEAADITAYPAEAEAIQALKAGKVDMVAGLTPSISRSLQDHLVFGPVFFWDSQAVLAHGAASLAALDGKTLCFLDDTQAAYVLMAAKAARGLRFIAFPFQEEGEMQAGLIGGHCAAVSASLSALAGMRAEIGGAGHDLVMLPERLSVVPLAVATRAGDAVWSAAIGAAADVPVLAEMQGVTSSNVQAMRLSADPVTRHLLGGDWSAAQALGLARDFALREIAAVGDYGAMFARSVGQDSLLGLARGMNAPCTRGGVICAAPLR
jgi:general L-amino acid transport system substrate-binding protein